MAYIRIYQSQLVWICRYHLQVPVKIFWMAFPQGKALQNIINQLIGWLNHFTDCLFTFWNDVTFLSKIGIRVASSHNCFNIWCHFFSHEAKALQAQIGHTLTSLHWISKRTSSRCSCLDNFIDMIYKKTRLSQLTVLEETSFDDLHRHRYSNKYGEDDCVLFFKKIPQFYYASPRRTHLRNHWLEEHIPILLCISTTPYSPKKSLIWRTYPNSTMHLHAVLPSEIIDFKNIPQFYYASPRRTPLRNHWIQEYTPILLCISTQYSPQKSLTWRTYPYSIIHLHAVLTSVIIDFKNIPQFFYASPRRTPLRNHWLWEHTPILLCISTPYSPQKSLTLKNIPQFYYASPRRTPLRNHWIEEYTPILLCISTPYSPQKSLTWRTYPNSIMHLHAVLPSEIIELKNIPQIYYASPRRIPLRNHWLEEHTPILLYISTPYSPQKSSTWRTYPNSTMHLHAILPSEIIDFKNIHQFYYASPGRTPLRNHWL